MEPKINMHPVVRSKKERVGWGKWALIYTRLCKHTGQEFRIRKNWHGSVPIGGIYCPACQRVTGILGD